MPRNVCGSGGTVRNTDGMGVRPGPGDPTPAALRMLRIAGLTAGVLVVVTLLVALIGYVVPHTAQPRPLGPAGDWRMIFSDDFTAAELDTTKWSTGWFGSGVTGPIQPDEQACYDPDHVRILPENQLALELTHKPQKCAGRTRPWSTGLISTNGKFQFTYGAIEARIFLPADEKGVPENWPGFWTNGQDWPHDGENDIVESLDGDVGPHFHSAQGDPGFVVPGSWGGWHTFGSVWEPGRVTYYYDGHPVGAITTGITGSPMYVILGYGPSTGRPSVPATMLVDYVRVWQK